jgi:hypothetical protein
MSFSHGKQKGTQRIEGNDEREKKQEEIFSIEVTDTF